MRNATLTTASLAVGFLLAASWPYYPLIELLTSPLDSEYDQVSRVFFEHALLPTAPILVVVPLVFWRLRRSHRDPFAWLVLVSLAIYVIGFFGNAGFGRAISWVGVFSQLAVAESLAALAARGPLPTQRWTAAVVVVTTLAVAGIFHGPTIARAWPRKDRRIAGDLLRGVVGENDVVLADLKTGRMLPSTTGKIVASPHTLWWVPDHAERRRDVTRFFENGLSDEERRRILDRWQVRFLVIDTRRAGSGPLLQELDVLATEETRDARYRLLRVR